MTRRHIDPTWLWMQQGWVGLLTDASSGERQLQNWGKGGNRSSYLIACVRLGPGGFLGSLAEQGRTSRGKKTDGEEMVVKWTS